MVWERMSFSVWMKEEEKRMYEVSLNEIAPLRGVSEISDWFSWRLNHTARNPF
jgi:hypothetical protein